MGKTTCAAATAIALAESRRRVLIVSTDPAHSLGDVLGARLSARPALVPTARGSLHAVELDADRALARRLARWRPTLRTIGARGTYLDDDDIERVLDLSWPGVDELVGLVELVRLSDAGEYDDVLVDTAPTGHTLRLLAMPAALRRMAEVLDGMQAKHRFLTERLARAYRPDAADALIAELDAEGRQLLEMLEDPARCRCAWVLLPERMAVEETIDGLRALAASGVTVDEVIVNRVASTVAAPCAPCARKARAEVAAIAELRRHIGERPVRLVPALSPAPRGVAALRRLARAAQQAMSPRAMRVNRAGVTETIDGRAPRGATWLDVVAPSGVRLLLFCGKGGVGKTSCAAATALALADAGRDRRVLALSVDHAHSLGDVFDTSLGDDERTVPHGPPSLRARELDAPRAFAERRDRYRASVDELFDRLRGGSRFDASVDRGVLRDLIDLAPPGTDELFAILSVVDALGLEDGRGGYDVVVVDTAPTGHALRLLDLPTAALEWVRAFLAVLLKYRAITGLGNLAADLVGISRRLRAFQDLVHDPRRARAVAISRAAELPRLETARLLRGLRALRIHPSAVIVNAMTAGGCDACRPQAEREARELRALRAPVPRVLAPATQPPPRGVEGLREWVRTWSVVAR